MVTSHTVDKCGNGYITHCGKRLHHTLWKRGEMVTSHTVERGEMVTSHTVERGGMVTSHTVERGGEWLHHTLWKRGEMVTSHTVERGEMVTSHTVERGGGGGGMVTSHTVEKKRGGGMVTPHTVGGKTREKKEEALITRYGKRQNSYTTWTNLMATPASVEKVDSCSLTQQTYIHWMSIYIHAPHTMKKGGEAHISTMYRN